MKHEYRKYYKLNNKLNYQANLNKFKKIPTEQNISHILSCFNIKDYDENTEFSRSDYENILSRLKQSNLDQFITITYHDCVFNNDFQEVVRMLRRFLIFINYGIKVRQYDEYGKFTHFSLYNYAISYNNNAFYRKSVTISRDETRRLFFD